MVAPVIAFFSIMYALRPASESVGQPVRLAAVRAALVTGAYAVLTVELLGAFGWLTAPALAAAWLLFLAVALALAGRRWRRTTATASTTATTTAAAGTTTAPTASTTAPTAPDRPRSVLGDARRAASSGWETIRAKGWRQASVAERLMICVIAFLVLAELVIALLAEPNNFDSQTYHLPKVEHWVQQGSLEMWATAIHRQVTIPPGAEYLLLHLRLLTGGDALYNLVQWAAAIGCLVVATRITAQLGGGRRAQIITAFLMATTPMVALQATSTQTDLVAAAWAGCAATLVLDNLSRRATFGTVLALGTATGLTAVTKTSGLIGVGPMLVVWGVAQLRRAFRPVPATEHAAAPSDAASGSGSRVRAVLGIGGVSVAILAVAAMITGPYLVRMTVEFGNPLGPPRLRESIPTTRHDPPAVLVNGLRIGHTALDTPLSPLRDVTASAIKQVAELVGVDPQDRGITFGKTTFPVPSWYPDEDRVAFPLAGALVLIAGVLALARPHRISPERAGTLRAYAAAITVTVVLHSAMIKWQPWGNRLVLYALLLAIPLAGVWLDAMFRRRASTRAEGAGRGGRRSVATLAAVAVLATSALSGVLAISYGFPRRLVGTGSLFTTSDWETRFLRRPQWAEEFRWAAQAVEAAGARRIGLVQQNDNWEYPWWLLLRHGDSGAAREIVALQSVLEGRPPADPHTVDAIVCTGDRRACTRLVPPGWQVEFRGYVGYALPPRAR
ncbi:hypothetical protein ACWDV4_24590 [Micromonospora sp. NPDC003197]